MAKNGFLPGLIGVAVGALLATLFGTGRLTAPAPAPRSDMARLERAVARLEAALLRRAERPATADVGRVPARAGDARGDPTRTTPDAERRAPISERDDAPDVIHPSQIRAIAGEITNADALRTRTAGKSPLDLIKTYMLWSYRDIVREFGKPTLTTISDSNPTFQYTFKGPDAQRVLQFVFIDGVVFRVMSY